MQTLEYNLFLFYSAFLYVYQNESYKDKIKSDKLK